VTVLLLVLLLVACVVWAAFGFGWNVWVRARSVKRHRQALETLADLTTGREANESGAAPMAGAGEGAHLRAGYQAHVRVFGPEGRVRDGQLPPPRPFARPQAAGASPLRRPSVAPAHEDATLPGRVLPPSPQSPQLPPGLPTRPVPVIRPHVYYFDDLTPRQGRAEGPPGGTSQGGAGLEVAPPAPPPPEAPAGERWLSADKLRWFGIAAAVAAIVLAAVAVVSNLPSNPPGRGAAQTTVAPQRAKPGASRPKQEATTTSVPPTTATTAPPKPAQLLSAGGGTATYQLRSKDALVVVKASGPCWIEVRVGSPQGQVVYEGTLEAGMMAHVTGPAWIRLGNPPAVTVLVDGMPMPVPGRQLAVPMNLQFTLG
jgi:hypothetical protein